MAKPLAVEKVAEITDLYSSGLNPTEIAASLKINRTTVYKYLKRSGAVVVSDYDSITAASRLTDQQKSNIVELYKRGLPITEIQRKLDTSADAIYREVNKQGLSRGVPEDQAEKAINLYLRDKLPVSEVLEITGLSRATFFRRLKKYRGG